MDVDALAVPYVNKMYKYSSISFAIVCVTGLAVPMTSAEQTIAMIGDIYSSYSKYKKGLVLFFFSPLKTPTLLAEHSTLNVQSMTFHDGYVFHEASEPAVLESVHLATLCAPETDVRSRQLVVAYS